MPTTVTLTVRGAVPAAGKAYAYTRPTTLIAGRARDCELRTPDDDVRVSRRHCRFDIDPPEVRVRDLGSLNGTYVNGRKIGGRQPGPRPGDDEQALADGDVVRVGRMELLVSVTAPADDAPFAVHDYELLRELGRGGQGVVRLARHKTTGELIAVKLLTAEVATDPETRREFLREIENIRALRHRNVVEFRGSGTIGEEPFFGCEYCEGGSVDQLIARRGTPMPLEEAVAIATQVLDALVYAHHAAIPSVQLADGSVESGRGLVHRDVKPQNILLSGPGDPPVVKLADFGLAKAFDRAGLSGLTRTGAVGGSVAFMPRAQIVNYKFARPEVDVWATAASLYWMLTGHAPRDFPVGSDPVAVVLREPPVPIRERLSSIPPRPAAVIDAMLVDSPRLPGTSAEEFKHALLQAL
ncbi:FHA domain-containing serine/threonine-protein kinase [Streptomyces sp. NPDC006332]|uniref:FHA domain-containing serine/threonine-protein kinase n=1 Tax=Streptomyces sp. NPDC006332 TaxID=3155456 RepID=UPI0033B9D3C7